MEVPGSFEHDAIRQREGQDLQRCGCSRRSRFDTEVVRGVSTVRRTRSPVTPGDGRLYGVQDETYAAMSSGQRPTGAGGRADSICAREAMGSVAPRIVVEFKKAPRSFRRATPVASSVRPARVPHPAVQGQSRSESRPRSQARAARLRRVQCSSARHAVFRASRGDRLRGDAGTPAPQGDATCSRVGDLVEAAGQTATGEACWAEATPSSRNYIRQLRGGQGGRRSDRGSDGRPLARGYVDRGTCSQQ